GIGVERLGELDLHGQRVHRVVTADDDAVFPAVVGQRRHHVVNGTRVDVLAPHDEHVVYPAVDAPWQYRIGASTGARTRLPFGEVAGQEADHGLAGALEVRVHR